MTAHYTVVIHNIYRLRKIVNLIYLIYSSVESQEILQYNQLSVNLLISKLTNWIDELWNCHIKKKYCCTNT